MKTCTESVRKLAMSVLVMMACTHQVMAEEKRPAVPGGIGDKPYQIRLTEGEITIGGYMDHELEIGTDSEYSTFDQHRYIPFIHAEPYEYIRVMAELEFEHGGLVSGEGSTDGEIKLEFAVMDLIFSEALGFRGGVVLSPLGKFNLIHDSPLNDLTERPIVDRLLIPSTLSEAGMGFFGSFYPGGWVVGYEVYVVNGFNQSVIVDSEDPESASLRIRGGRGSQKSDNNNDKAVVGRFSASPILGAEIGVSAHTGKYDDHGNHRLTILALDANVARGPLEFLGELALADADADRTVYPMLAESQLGYYAQVNAHFGHDLIRRFPHSVFTGVVRYGRVDFDADRIGDDISRTAVGVNFRPVETVVFKLDHYWQWERAVNASTWSTPSTVLFFSIASYF